ncbi:MAG: hypothetical protein ACK551_01400 [Vampirovibrionales bacterium]
MDLFFRIIDSAAAEAAQSSEACPSGFRSMADYVEQNLKLIKERVTNILKARKAIYLELDDDIDCDEDDVPMTQVKAILHLPFMQKNGEDHEVSFSLTPEIRLDSIPTPFERFQYLVFQLGQIQERLTSYKPWFEETEGYQGVGKLLEELRTALVTTAQESEKPQ